MDLLAQRNLDELYPFRICIVNKIRTAPDRSGRGQFDRQVQRHLGGESDRAQGVRDLLHSRGIGIRRQLL